MEPSKFLREKYNIQSSPEVEKAVKAKERKSKEKLSKAPEERIQTYLDRLQNIIYPPKLKRKPDFDRKQRNLELLKQSIHQKFIIKPEEIPESYFEHQKRIAKEQGHGDIEITKESKEQATNQIIEEQRNSLDYWIDYLTGDDAFYPDWLKYWAIRSVLGMGDYDKVTHSFSKRRKDTVKPFPPLNQQALAEVLDSIEKKYKIKEDRPYGPVTEWQALLDSENFSKLYAHALELATSVPQEGLENTKGLWIKYPKNSNPEKLVKSLANHNTGWCTARESAAGHQLERGDFYVYYSEDKDGNPTIPRVAIRMQNKRIAEVRGIAEGQNLDLYITSIVQNKMKDFLDGPQYERKVRDMKFLTLIDNKIQNQEELTKEELVFLYESDSKIEGFGYKKDPRIKELRNKRNKEKDISTIFNYQKEQIARNIKEINQNTRVYIGKLEPKIFEIIQKYNIEHIYASFPEGKIGKIDLTVGGQSKEDFFNELAKKEKFKEINISEDGKSMLQNKNFTTLNKPENLKLIRLKVRDLFEDSQAHTVGQIYQRAQELGLELCPPEVGPRLRLQCKDQPLNEWFFIAMKPIIASGGHPRVFWLGHNAHGVRLSGSVANPRDRWNPEYEIIFSSR